MSLSEKERKTILVKVMGKFSAAYGKEFTADQVREWYHQVGHLDERTALATADAAIKHHQWMPRISEFLEISRSIRKQQEADAPIVREARLHEHYLQLQAKGLSVQKALIASREGARRHDHRNGWEQCEICAQAATECDSDECRTCFILDNEGLDAFHFAG